MSSNTSDGLILVCTRHGIVEQVLYDGLELSDGRSVGLSFTSLVLSESLLTATEMLEALQRDSTAFDWVLNVRAGGQKVLLHTLGYTLDEKLILIGAQSRTLLRELHHHMLKSHHREISGASELVDEERNAHLAREQQLQAKVDELTDQLNTLQIEVNQKYMLRPPLSEPAPETGLHLPNWLRRREQLVRDLRACEEARTALHHSQTLFATIFRASPVALLVTAPADGRVVDVNAQFEQLLGYPHDEVVGKPSHQFFASANRELMAKATATLIAQPGIYDAALTLRAKNGGLIESQVSLSLADTGEQQYVVHTLADMAERQPLAEAERAELAQLRDSVSTLEQTLAQREADAEQLSTQLASLSEELSTRKENEQSLLAQVAALLERASGEQLWRRSLEQSVTEHEQRERSLQEQVSALAQDKAALLEKQNVLFEQVKQFVTQQKQREQELNSRLAELQARSAEAEGQVCEREAREQEHLHDIQDMVGELGVVNSIMEQRAGLVGDAPTVRPEYAEAIREALSVQPEFEQSLLEQLRDWAVHAAGRAQQLVEQVTSMAAGDGVFEQELAVDRTREQDWLLQITSLREQVARLGAQIGELQTRERELLAYIRVLERTPSEQELSGELAHLRAYVASLETQAADLRQQGETLRVELSTWQQNARALTSGQAALQERLSELSSELQSRHEVERDLRSQIGAFHDMAGVQQQARQLQQELDAARERLRALEPQIRQGNADLFTLNSLARLALEAPSARLLLESAVQQAGEQLGAVGAYAMRWSEPDQRLVPAAAHGLYGDTFPALPIAQRELNLEDPVLFAGHALFSGAGLATLSLPLVVQGMKQGLLLVTFKDAHEFHPLAIERAEQFAAQIALAMRHVQMHEDWRLQLEAEQERQEQLRQLTLGLAEGEELIQQQLASQLQRRVGQNLTLLSVGLDTLPDDLPADSAPIVAQRVNASQKLIAEIGNHVRDVIAELYPPALDDGGLIEALRWYSLQLLKSTGFRAVVQGEPSVPPLEPMVERVLFRIAQRTLANVSHAQARSPVFITLSELEHKTRLSIAGDGVMLTNTELNTALLKGRARATAIGGDMHIDGQPGQHAELTVEIPKAG